MSKSARRIMIFLLFAMGLNHAVMGLFWVGTSRLPVLFCLAIALYVVALTVSLYWHAELKLSRLQAYLNLVISILAPVLVVIGLPVTDYKPTSYQTWFVGGVSFLLAITSARGFPRLAWLGLASLWLVVLIWGGIDLVTETGLVGALLMVVAAWAIGRGLRSTEAAADSFNRQTEQIKTETAQSIASRETRHQMLQQIMFSGLPLLQRIRDQEGALSEADKAESQLLESRLRDEIQGSALLNDGVRLATREARKRGVEVSFNDEGGFDRFNGTERTAIYDSIIQALNSTNSGKILIAAPKGQNFGVAITATRPEAAGPDLWLRLP